MMFYTYLICTALVFTTLGMVAHGWWSMRGKPPANLTYAVDAVNHGFVPDELALLIPSEYELRDEYTMRASINRIFAYRGGRPMWSIDLTLCDGVSCIDHCVLFDSNGDLYQ